jgi:cytochrome c oxidase subunit 2
MINALTGWISRHYPCFESAVNPFTLSRMRIFAFAALLCLASGTYVVTSASQTSPEEPRVIEVVAKRYAFEPSEIQAVAGERLRIVVRSGDGMHGFEIKKFKVSKEIPRGGDPVVIEFTPTEVGRFPIACSLFCGDGHEDMKGALVVSAGETPAP